MEEKYKHLKAAAYLTQFGLNMVSPIILCVIIAVWVKNKFNIGNWIVLLAIILGVCTSAFNMLSYIKTVNNEMGGKEHDEKRKN